MSVVLGASGAFAVTWIEERNVSQCLYMRISCIKWGGEKVSILGGRTQHFFPVKVLPGHFIQPHVGSYRFKLCCSLHALFPTRYSCVWAAPVGSFWSFWAPAGLFYSSWRPGHHCIKWVGGTPLETYTRIIYRCTITGESADITMPLRLFFWACEVYAGANCGQCVQSSCSLFKDWYWYD